MTSIAEQFREAFAREQQREGQRRQEDAERARKTAHAEQAARLERYAQEDERAERERAKQLEADRRARTHAAEAELKASLRAKYMELPGATPAGFVALWPRLLEEHQLRAVVSAPSLADEYRAFRRTSTGRPE